MKLYCFGSGSKGNLYLLRAERSALVIEAGLSIAHIKEAMDYDLRAIDGCIITHEHGDHLGKIKEFLVAGIPCFGSKGTFDGIDHHNIEHLDHGKKYKIGDFLVMPFDAVHDCRQPFSYLIKHPEMGLLLFATDTSKIKSRVTGLNYIMIEANYAEDIIDSKLGAGGIPDKVLLRTGNSHMSISGCLEYLSSIKLTGVNKIILIHLSDGNSNAAKFKALVEAQTGKPVVIADSGLIEDVSLSVF